MEALLNSNCSISFSSTMTSTLRCSPSRQLSYRFQSLTNRSFILNPRAIFDLPGRLKEFDAANPTIPTYYRNAEQRRPNNILLDAQSRICTRAMQIKPLTQEEARSVFVTILKSATGDVDAFEELVSRSQLGAFFAAMTIRANAFPRDAQWSDWETRIMRMFWPILVEVLPPEVIFVADPEGSILRTPWYTGNTVKEKTLAKALRKVLKGLHISYEEVEGILKECLPLGSTEASEVLLSALLTGQQMLTETQDELAAYCLTFDDEHGPTPMADVHSLTHYGEPYDGNTKYFRSTLFVAAVRSCYGESGLLHGVNLMAPKGYY